MRALQMNQDANMLAFCNGKVRDDLERSFDKGITEPNRIATLAFITSSMTIFFPGALEDSATDAMINLGKSSGPSTEPTIGVHTK